MGLEVRGEGSLGWLGWIWSREQRYLWLVFPVRVFQGKSCVNDVCMIYVFFVVVGLLFLCRFAYS
jgi:hypothetical protein